jgi:predicted ATPase
LTGAERAAFEEAARSGRIVPDASFLGSSGQLLEDVAPAPPTNLPAPATPFVGRTVELRAVNALLCRAEIRLLTLTGPGGTGKTRLAIEAARGVHELFEDGVFFVSLGAVVDPAQVLPTIRRTLGIEDRGAASNEVVQEHLRNRRVLLVLDTFEHVLPAGSTVAALLGTCLKLKVLVTSRALLHLSGEHHFPVPPMTLPPATAETTAEEIERHDATSLFAQRAQAIDPHFRVTAQHASVIRGICARLDGLPLAIELAAARVNVLPLAALLDRLSDRRSLLSRGARDAPERQQTMRATIDWSYQLLDRAEQRLLARLGVFVGGWTLEAAETVCGLDEDRDILEGLSSLVESSLLRVVEGVGGEPRFLMLDTIHEYATEKLAESGEAEIVARRHAEYFVRLAEGFDAEFSSTRGVRSSARHVIRMLEAERDNLAAARTWLREQGEAILGLRLMGALGPRWVSLDYEHAKTVWLEGFEPSLGQAPPLVRARVLLHKGGLLCQSEEEIRELEEAVTLYREAGDEPLLLRGLVVAASGMAYKPELFPLRTVRLEKAEKLFGESLALARRLGSKPGEGASLRGLANCAFRLRNDRARAQALFEESLAVERQAGNVIGIADTASTLGALVAREGDLAKGAALLGEATACYRELGLEGEAHATHFASAALALQQENHAAIIATFRTIRANRRLAGYRGLRVAWVLLLASSAARQGDATRAGRLFGAVYRAWGDSCFYHHAEDWMDLFASYRSAVRSQLEETAWTEAWEEGQAMTVEQAIVYALGETQ